MIFTAEQLETVLEEHKKWLRSNGGSRADLTRADLTGAVLTGADLTRADLTRADLTGAVLTRADLTRAVLMDAVLTDADLTDADLTGAVLTRADLTGAYLTGAVGVSAPIIPNIDAEILKAIETPGNALRMDVFHACETAHCRAGWAIVIAGPAGKMLEDRIGAGAAGSLIYAASRPGKPVPNFYATDEEAMADIRACAAESA